MLRIVLTGGIGGGKTTVANYFSKLKVSVIDADHITHKILESNQDVYKKIIKHFGVQVLTTKKKINRTKLRALIFENKKERLWLEKLIHPIVRTNILKKIAAFSASYCIIVIPLFFEVKFKFKADRILVVDCLQKEQLARIIKRPGYSIKQAKAIISAQMKRSERLKRADDVLYNSGTLAQLKRAVRGLHDYYNTL